MKIHVKITPNAKKSEVLSEEHDLSRFAMASRLDSARLAARRVGGKTLRVKVAAPPIEGKANKELINILSKHFKVSKSKISIIGGEKSRNKIVEIKE